MPVDPGGIFTPETAEEVARFLEENASGRRQPAYAVGGGTALDYGYPPQGPGATVATEHLARLIDYPARDMTVTVEAGMRVSALAELLRGERQQLPIDVPQADVATIGGVLATNVSGPRRFGYGTLRDYVIGISAVDGQGRLFKAGGRVVKNVAGYDLCKLLIGSLGTLAVITQVTLKLRPIPEHSGLLLAAFNRWDQIEAALDRLLLSAARPVIVDLLSRDAAQSVATAAQQEISAGEATLVVGVEGAEPDVAWQLEQLTTELASFSPDTVYTSVGDAAHRLLQAMTEWQAAGGDVTLRANLPSSKTTAFAQSAIEQGAAVHAHAGNGIIIGRLPGGANAKSGISAALGTLRQWARSARGNLVVGRCPDAWKADLPLWGDPEPAWPLMLKVKHALDPHNLLNPGRFIDGAKGGRGWTEGMPPLAVEP